MSTKVVDFLALLPTSCEVSLTLTFLGCTEVERDGEPTTIEAGAQRSVDLSTINDCDDVERLVAELDADAGAEIRLRLGLPIS